MFRKSLLLLIIAGGLAMLSLLAAAAFTAQASVTNNTFTAGTLNLTVSPTSAALTFSNMAPGDRVTAPINVTNSGSLDLRYAMTSHSIGAAPLGGVWVGGLFTSYNGVARNRVALLNSAGALDTTFDPGAGANSNVLASVVQSDGKFVMGGEFTAYDGVARNFLARLNSGGALDPTFNPGPGISSSDADPVIQSVVVQSDGKIVIGGEFDAYNGVARNRIARLNSDGSLDPTFDPGTGANQTIFSVVLQTDGKIVIVGYFNTYNGVARNRIARLNSDGSLDTVFDPGTGASPYIRSVDIQTDGKIVIGGGFTAYNGVPRNNIARLHSNGALDTTFDPGTGPNGAVYAVDEQSDGKIVIGGGFTTYSGVARNRIARLNSTGALDTAFDPGTGANNWVYTAVVQVNGKIVVGGQFTTFNGIARNYLARLNSDGSLDTAFDPGAGSNGAIYAVIHQVDDLARQIQLTIKAGVTACTDGGFALSGTTIYSGLLVNAFIGNPTVGTQAWDRHLTAATGESLCFQAVLPSGTGNAYQGVTTTTTFTFNAEQIANNP